jgi:lysophospholipase L1-like esterase
MKDTVVAIAISLVSLLLAVVAAEGVLHLAPGLLPVEVRAMRNDRGIADPELGHLMRPGSTGVIETRDFAEPFRIDAHGFRNAQEWPERPDVVAIGDSLVFGYGATVDEAWPQRIAADTGWSVVNLGLIGASPQQYLRIWQRFGPALKPRVVVVAMYLGNDFWDAAQFEQWLASGVRMNYLEWRDYGRPSAKDLQSLTGRARLWLFAHSNLVALARLAWRALDTGSAEDSKVIALADGQPMRLAPGYIRDKGQYAIPGDPIFGIVLNSLLQLGQSAAAQGTELVVVVQPTKEAVYARAAGFGLSRPGIELIAELQARGVTAIDLFDEFAAAADQGARLFFTNDGHPNSEGYRLIAESLSGELHKYLDAEPRAE